MRVPVILSAAAALLAGNPNESQAQNTPRQVTPDSSCTHYGDGRVECIKISGGMRGDSSFRRFFFREDSAMIKRAALGLELRPTGTRRDTLGVFVASVTPRGPAETAGIVEGDRIAAINGVDVRSAAGDIEDPYTNGLASHRLTREIQKLTPGTRVTLRVYSGGRFRDVAVTTGRASEVFRQAGRFNFRFPGVGGGMAFGSPDVIMFPKVPLELERMERIELPRTQRMLLPRSERIVVPRAAGLRRIAPTRITQPGSIRI